MELAVSQVIRLPVVFLGTLVLEHLVGPVVQVSVAFVDRLVSQVLMVIWE